MVILRQKTFAEKTSLKDIKSHRGLGRAGLIGGTTGAIGGYVGKKAAEKADEEGKSDKEILDSAKSSATKAGLAAGGVGLALNAKNLKTMHDKSKAIFRSNNIPNSKAGKIAKGIVIGSSIGALGASALGARLGAKKNTEIRLKKRAEENKEN